MFYIPRTSFGEGDHNCRWRQSPGLSRSGSTPFTGVGPSWSRFARACAAARRSLRRPSSAESVRRIAPRVFRLDSAAGLFICVESLDRDDAEPTYRGQTITLGNPFAQMSLTFRPEHGAVFRDPDLTALHDPDADQFGKPVGVAWGRRLRCSSATPLRLYRVRQEAVPRGYRRERPRVAERPGGPDGANAVLHSPGAGCRGPDIQVVTAKCSCGASLTH